MEERFKIARVKKLCFNCLSSSHSSSNDGPSKKRCHTCQRDHHTSLHFVDAKAPISRPSTETTATFTSVSAATLTVATPHWSGPSNSFVFFETARAMVQSQGVKTKGNVLIDKGAQRLFITFKLAKLLNLRPILRENLILAGFSLENSSAEYYDVGYVNKTCLLDCSGSSFLIQAIMV